MLCEQGGFRNTSSPRSGSDAELFTEEAAAHAADPGHRSGIEAS
ncbi:MAG: hypothetical protein ABIO51_01925 [Solirubrobacteraceae bacterium]